MVEPSEDQSWFAQGSSLSGCVRVAVETQYVAGDPYPYATEYLFAYRITIVNEGDATVQLLRRHWRITDGYGRVERVDGDGVLGEQPRLGAGETYRYVSYCSLPTAYGTMQGEYDFRSDGRDFVVTIPAFTLVAPGPVH